MSEIQGCKRSGGVICACPRALHSCEPTRRNFGSAWSAAPTSSSAGSAYTFAVSNGVLCRVAACAVRKGTCGGKVRWVLIRNLPVGAWTVPPLGIGGVERLLESRGVIRDAITLCAELEDIVHALVGRRPVHTGVARGALTNAVRRLLESGHVIGGR